MARVLSSVHAISTTCSLCWTSLCAACLYIITRPHSQLLCTRVYILHDFLWPKVQPHSDDSQMHVTAPCSARVLGQARPTMLVHFLVAERISARLWIEDLFSQSTYVCTWWVTLRNVTRDVVTYHRRGL